MFKCGFFEKTRCEVVSLDNLCDVFVSLHQLQPASFIQCPKSAKLRLLGSYEKSINILLLTHSTSTTHKELANNIQVISAGAVGVHVNSLQVLASRKHTRINETTTFVETNFPLERKQCEQWARKPR